MSKILKRLPLWLRVPVVGLIALIAFGSVAAATTACSSQPSSYEQVTADYPPTVSYISYGGVHYCPVMSMYSAYGADICTGYGSSQIVVMPMTAPSVHSSLAYAAFLWLAGYHTWYMGGSYYSRYVYQPVTVVHHHTIVYQGHTLGATGYKSTYVTKSETTFNKKYKSVETKQASKVQVKDKNGNTVSGSGHVVKRAPKRNSGHVATTGPHSASTSKPKHTTGPAPRHTVRKAPPRVSTNHGSNSRSTRRH